MSTSRSKQAPHGVITKHSHHPFAALLLGTVTGVHWMGDNLVLYYADGHKAVVHAEFDELTIADYEVPSC